MARFDHLKTREIAGKTAWLSLPVVTSAARLQLRPATDANPAYHNGNLKMAVVRHRGSATRGVDKYDIAASRDDDRVLYAQFVLTGWEGIEDCDGNVVPFSVEAATEFLEQLPDWIFDRVRLFAIQPENFVDHLAIAKASAKQVEQLAGNSQTGSAGS